MKRIFGAAGQAQTQFLQGFKMGAIVGGIFGGLTGIYYAYQTKSLLVIPMVALTSGGSFGFFMGVGMIMRSEMEGADEESHLYDVCIIREGSGEVEYTPIYQKYQEKLL
jgi:Reactive mitochondrial oxygen species modulator 1